MCVLSLVSFCYINDFSVFPLFVVFLHTRLLWPYFFLYCCCLSLKTILPRFRFSTCSLNSSGGLKASIAGGVGVSQAQCRGPRVSDVEYQLRPSLIFGMPMFVMWSSVRGPRFAG